MTEADRPELERLYDRMCPGQKTNLGTDANYLGAVVERNGKIVAAALGNLALVAVGLLLADPDAAESAEAAHDANAVLASLLNAARGAAENGSMVGQIVVVPASLSTLGAAMDRAGFFSRDDEAAVHVSLGLNVADEKPVATA
jgi:hypothetical protein